MSEHGFSNDRNLISRMGLKLGQLGHSGPQLRNIWALSEPLIGLIHIRLGGAWFCAGKVISQAHHKMGLRLGIEPLRRTCVTPAHKACLD